MQIKLTGWMAENQGDSFFLTLLKDVSVALSRRESADNQVTRRDMVRTAFAAIEGLVWIFREEIVETADSTYGLEDDERSILQERQLAVSEQGKVTSQSRYLSLTTTIRFIARIASRINGFEHFEFDGAEWDNFRKAIVVRNRITHPKSADDLHVSKADVEQVTNALFWFLSKHVEVLAQTVETRKAYLGEFDEVLEKLKSGDPEVTSLYNALRQSRD